MLVMLGGCNASRGEGFSIYLTKDDIPPQQIEALSYVEKVDQPIISMTDIITYNAQTHEIKLTAIAYERICNLEIPVEGKSFMVCIDRKPIYWGAFWTPVSSISFDGVTIRKPLTSQKLHVITLELGYPSSSFYRGEDPRNNTEIIKSLEISGKLINKLIISEIDSLPHSLKGYELYSWLEDEQWHFTLITGTNRTKILEEIISEVYYVSETDWVNIHTVGVETIKIVLGKLPQDESVSWRDELHIGQVIGENINLQLPPIQIINDIKEHAEQCGLNFQIHTP